MILDTNGLSAFLDGIEAVVSLLAKTDAVHLPVIVIGEYRYGLRSSRLVLQQNEWNGIANHDGTEEGGARPRWSERPREPI